MNATHPEFTTSENRTPGVYFNEFDPFASAWLRELVACGHLPPASVDERSITDVEATDVRRHRECHWFAGIGGWPLALRLAGWPAERPVWTGSCPCQPYSSAGKRKGNADERDLWPVFARLIRECRPECVFGEQVSAAIRFGWLDRLCADMEAEGYTVGACVLGAHSAGADHQRQRLYWVAHDQEQRFAQRAADAGRVPSGVRAEGLGRGPADDCATRGVAHTEQHGRGSGHAEGRDRGRSATGRDLANGDAEQRGGAVWDHWRDAVGIDCRDGKRRRVPAQPGVQLLADGLSSSVGRGGVPCAARYPLAGKSPNRAARLRGYGNAICVQTAALFVRAFLESEGAE